MGQKVHPIGIRLGIVKDWTSKWYADSKEYADLLNTDLEVRSYLKKRLADVQKQPFTVRDLKIDGHDVMKILKVTPGPLVGKVLNQLFEEVIEKKLKNERGPLLKRLKQLKKGML